MSNKARNLEEVVVGQIHPMNITFLDKPNGSPVHPDGFDPGNPNDVSAIMAAIKILTLSTGVYTDAPGGYNAPTLTNLRYSGSKGSFLVDLNAQTGTTPSASLSDEAWTIVWGATIGGVVLGAPEAAEIFTVLSSPGIGFGSSGYADISCVREELVQGLDTNAFKIEADGPANPNDICLPDRTSEAIVSVMVNGSTTTAYSWDGLDLIEFSPALSVGDVVKVVRDMKVSDARVEKDIVVASNIVNKHLGTRYDVPFDSDNIPPIVADAACALAAMRIRMRFFGSTGSQHGDPHADKEWEYWMGELAAIAKGEETLLDANGERVTPRNSGIRATPNRKPIFSMEDVPDLGGVPRNSDYPKDFTDPR